MRMSRLTQVRSLAHRVTFIKSMSNRMQPTKIATARHIKNWFVIINAHNGKQKTEKTSEK